jgi:hypothetical protein
MLGVPVKWAFSRKAFKTFSFVRTTKRAEQRVNT